MKLKNRDKIISSILLLLWCGLIFYFSQQNGQESLEDSNFIVYILNAIVKIFNSYLDVSKIPYITLIVRKLAHFFLYFVLYILAFNFSKKHLIKKIFLFSILFCILYAISDEVHQLFINERSFKLLDILIDSSGALLASFILHKKI